MSYKFMKFIFSILIMGLVGCLIAFGINAFQEFSKPIKDEIIETIENTGAIIEIKENITTPQIVETRIEDIETATTPNIEYQSSSSNKHFFYEQLDSPSKKIYDGMESNIENMKTGNFSVEYGDSFSSILEQENGQDIIGNCYQSAIEAFTYDNPQVFFLDPTKMFLNIQKTTKGKVSTYNAYITNAEGSDYLASGLYSVEQINTMQAEIEQVKNEVLSNLSGSKKDRIKYIHDYLVDNISYDQTISKDNIYNLYGALINKECVCEGYAKAFKYLLDEAGIECTIVIGTGTNSKGLTENHAWNYVALDGAWYAVDTTWDDPVMQGWGVSIPSTYKYKYFLKGQQTINSDHVASGQFTEGGKIFNYPNVSNSDY